MRINVSIELNSFTFQHRNRTAKSRRIDRVPPSTLYSSSVSLIRLAFRLQPDTRARGSNGRLRRGREGKSKERIRGQGWRERERERERAWQTADREEKARGIFTLLMYRRPNF